MASYTTNLNLKKPAGSENVAIGDINNNMDAIDQAYGTLNDKLTNRVYCETFQLQSGASKTIKYQTYSMTIISTSRDASSYATLAYVTRGGVNLIVSQTGISYSMSGDTLTITNSASYAINVTVVDLNKDTAPVVIS